MGVPLLIRENNSVAGVNGASVLATDRGSGDPLTPTAGGTATVTYSNSFAGHEGGTVVDCFANSGAQAAYVSLTELNRRPVVFLRYYGRRASTPAVSQSHVVLRDRFGVLAGDTQILATTGVIRMRDKAGAALGTDGTVAVATAASYRFELMVNTLTGSWAWKLFQGANLEGTTASDSASGTGSGSTFLTNIDRIDIGNGATNNPGTLHYFVYDLAISANDFVGAWVAGEASDRGVYVPQEPPWYGFGQPSPQPPILTLDPPVWDLFSPPGLADAGTFADQLTVAGAIPLTDVVGGVDALTVGAAVPLADVGSGADALTVAPVISLADTALGVDALTITAATIPLADTVTGADSLAVTVPVALADTGAGVDALSVSTALQLAETGHGTDSLAVTGAIPLTELGSGADALTLTTIAVPLAETGSGVDAVVVAAAVPLTELGSLTDAISVASSGSNPSLPETAAGTDALTLSAAVPLTELAAGADALTVTIAVPLADTGHGTDAITETATVPLIELAAGADALTVAAAVPLPADTGHGTDAVTVAVGVPLAETITAVDAISIVVSVPLADTITGSDAISEAVALQLADLVSALDAIATSTGSAGGTFSGRDGGRLLTSPADVQRATGSTSASSSGSTGARGATMTGRDSQAGPK